MSNLRPVVCRLKRLIPASDTDALDKVMVCRGCTGEVLVGWDIQIAIDKEPGLRNVIVCEDCYQRGLEKTIKQALSSMPPKVREEFDAKVRAELSRLFPKDGPGRSIGGIDSKFLR